jgi:ribosomal protein S18 acetylase RimI-like enzyme
VIRQAVPGDARALAEVHVASWIAGYRGLMPDEALAALDVDERAERWRRGLSDGTASALVAEDDDGIYGWATVGRSRDPDAGDEVGELWSLYVHPRCWGRGLGRELHDACLEELRRRGFAQATLWVMDTNERARRFYERQGWRTDGSVKADRVGELQTPIEDVRYTITL